jgi:hypothetical protein
MLPAIGPGAGPTGRFKKALVPSGMYQGTFAKKKSGPRTPRPPGGPPALGSLVWSAEGLPSTRKWPFQWPLPPTSQPAPGDTQGNVSRQLAGAVVLGGWSCTSAATRGQRALLRFFNSSGLVKQRAVPRPSGPAWPGRAGRGG